MTRVHRRRQRPAGRRLPSAQTRSAWFAASTKTPRRARRRGQSRLSISNRAHRAWRRYAPRVRSHRARRRLRRRRPCVETRRSGCAMPACLSASSCRSIRCWAIRCPVTFTSGAAWRHDGVTDRNSGAIFRPHRPRVLNPALPTVDCRPPTADHDWRTATADPRPTTRRPTTPDC